MPEEELDAAQMFSGLHLRSLFVFSRYSSTLKFTVIFGGASPTAVGLSPLSTPRWNILSSRLSIDFAVTDIWRRKVKTITNQHLNLALSLLWCVNSYKRYQKSWPKFIKSSGTWPCIRKLRHYPLLQFLSPYDVEKVYSKSKRHYRWGYEGVVGLEREPLSLLANDIS